MKISVSILASPLFGFTLAFIFMTVVSLLFFRSTPRKVDRYGRRLQLVSASLYSLGHGGNDAQKTMGIIAILLYSTGHLGKEFHVPLWVVLACHVAMGVGTLFGGWRIVKTMGMKITKLKPIGGFCAETAGAFTLFLATHLGIPVSTTHTITPANGGTELSFNFLVSTAAIPVYNPYSRRRELQSVPDVADAAAALDSLTAAKASDGSLTLGLQSTGLATSLGYASAEDATTITRAYTGKTCRVIRNGYTDEFAASGGTPEPFPGQVLKSMGDGANHLGCDSDEPGVDPDREFMPAGQGMGAIDELVPAADLVRQFVAEAESVLDRVATLRG
jgi:hypothetical protein